MDIFESNAAAPTAANMPADLADAFEDLGLTEYANDGPAPKPGEVPAKPTREERTAAREAKKDDIDGETDDVTRTAATETDDEKADAAPLTAEEQLAKDAEELRGVRIRAKQRKAAREARAAGREAPAPAPAAAAAPAAVKPAEVPKPATADEREVARAVQDVIAQIARMTSEDEAAAKSGDPKTATEAKARAAELAGLQGKVDALTASLDESKTLREKFGAIEERLKDQADQAFVRERAEIAIDLISDKLPNLSTRRNAAALVVAQAEHFYKKTGKVADLRFVAQKVEAALAKRAAGNPDTEETPAAASKATNGETKRTPTRKTVSNSTATPPSERKGPDKRTKEEVEKDLFAYLGIEDQFTDD
jgi:hypothetical protein